jgi:hypothetical protein
LLRNTTNCKPLSSQHTGILHRLIGSSTHRLIHSSTHRLIDASTHRLLDTRLDSTRLAPHTYTHWHIGYALFTRDTVATPHCGIPAFLHPCTRALAYLTHSRSLRTTWMSCGVPSSLVGSTPRRGFAFARACDLCIAGVASRRLVALVDSLSNHRPAS